MRYDYVPKNREGDHICYISDLRKMKAHYRGWDITRSVDDIVQETVRAWGTRMNAVSTLSHDDGHSKVRVVQ